MYTFIINPASRSGLGGQVWSRLEPVLKDNHIPYRAWQTGYQRHATRLARELTADGKEHTIIVLGGDGTVNEVVDGIRDLDRVILGYIPVGSGNDFARSLGIPKDPKAALRLVLSPPGYAPMNAGQIAYSDHAGRTRTKRFAVSAGLGFDAAICHQAVISRLKPVLNRLHLGKLTYALIALDRFRLLRRATFTVTLDDAETLTLTDAFFAAAMNHPFEGGGFLFCPAADPCDGRLDLAVLSGVSRLWALLLLPLALKGAHTRAKGITIRTFERAVLTSDTALPVHTDGEPVFLQRRMEISLAPGRLRVIAPGS